MKHITALFVLCGATMAGATGVDSMYQRAAWLLFNRHLNANYLNESYHLLSRARNLEPNHEKVCYLWSRIHVRLGDDAASKDEKLRYYGRAKAIAESLVAMQPDNADGHIWLGIAQGRIGMTRGVMNSLFMVPSLKRTFGRAMELDPSLAVAYDAFGVLYYELPAIAGGDLALAEYYFVRGLTLDPDYSVIRLDLAKVYIRQKRWNDAREQLKLVTETSYPTYPADWALYDKPEAEKLLAEISSR